MEDRVTKGNLESLTNGKEGNQGMEERVTKGKWRGEERG